VNVLVAECSHLISQKILGFICLRFVQYGIA
jgi:hypothetical protein